MYLDVNDVEGTAIMGGGVRLSLVNHYQNQWQSVAHTGLGHLFQDRIQQMHNAWLSPEALASQEAALRMVNHVISSDVIRPLHTIDDIQLAKPIMRDYIMAMPGMYERFVKEEISGYDGNFTLPGTQTGTYNPYYQKAMNGWGVETDTHFEFTTYDIDDEEELSYGSQQAVHQTWDNVKHYLDLKEDDPTDVLGNSL